MIKLQFDDTLTVLDQKILDAEPPQRDWLGISEIGHECDRYLWLKHNGILPTPPDARLTSLFRLGDMIEDYFANLMGVTDRQEVVSTGRLEGHTDGRIYPVESPKTQHVWECKSINHAGFGKIKNHGYENYNASYKGQIHVYPFLLDLKRAFVVVYDKNNSDRLCERINVDKSYAKDVIDRAHDICDMQCKPHGICKRPTNWTAKMCGYREECFGPQVVKQKNGGLF